MVNLSRFDASLACSICMRSSLTIILNGGGAMRGVVTVARMVVHPVRRLRNKHKRYDQQMC